MDHPPSQTPDMARETVHIQRVALYAFLLNLAQAVIKGGLAVHTGSLAITAGAIDAGFDSVASLLLLGGLRLSSKKTPTFPLGLYKIENVISVCVGLFIFFAGYEIARQVLLGQPVVPDIPGFALLLLLLGAAAIFLFGRYALAVGRRTGSPTLIAEGRHRQVDVLSSLVVLGAVGLAYLGWDFTVLGFSVDQIAAGLVLIFMVRAGWSLLKDGMRVLLDASLDFKTLSKVREILEAHPQVVAVNSLAGRSAGRFRFLQADLALRTEDLRKALQVSQTLEERIRREVPHVEQVLLHTEPRAQTHARLALPLDGPQGPMSEHFGRAAWFVVLTVRLRDMSIEGRDILVNPFKDVEKAKGIQTAEWLAARKIDFLLVRENLAGKGPEYVLANAGVELILVEGPDKDPETLAMDALAGANSTVHQNGAG